MSNIQWATVMLVSHVVVIPVAIWAGMRITVQRQVDARLNREMWRPTMRDSVAEDEAGSGGE